MTLALEPPSYYGADLDERVEDMAEHYDIRLVPGADRRDCGAQVWLRSRLVAELPVEERSADDAKAWASLVIKGDCLERLNLL